MPISGKQFCKLLESDGWRLLRVSGSHHIYGKPGSDIRLSVPVHGNAALKVAPSCEARRYSRRLTERLRDVLAGIYLPSFCCLIGRHAVALSGADH